MSSTKRVINNSLQPEMLESGQQLGAAGQPGSVREDVILSEGDYERLVERGTVAVVEVSSPTQAPADAPEPEAAQAKSGARGRRQN